MAIAGAPARIESLASPVVETAPLLGRRVLITGATGLDDWEWGVTLLTDDPVVTDGLFQMIDAYVGDEADAG